MSINLITVYKILTLTVFWGLFHTYPGSGIVQYFIRFLNPYKLSQINIEMPGSPSVPRTNRCHIPFNWCFSKTKIVWGQMPLKEYSMWHFFAVSFISSYKHWKESGTSIKCNLLGVISLRLINS